MKKIEFIVKLSIYSDRWRLKPIDKTAEGFVPESRGNYVSFFKIFEKFKDGQILKITIKEKAE